MRRLIPVAFTLLILLNVMGYYILLLGLEYKTGKDLVRRFDQGTYDPDKSITLKIPLTMPYGITEGGYERVDGEFEYEGEYYRLIKQRFSNDTLYVVCMKDIQRTHINQTLADHVRTFADHAGESRHTGKIVINLVKDFLPPGFAITNASRGWSQEVSQDIPVYFHYNISTSVLSPPPKA